MRYFIFEQKKFQDCLRNVLVNKNSFISRSQQLQKDLGSTANGCLFVKSKVGGGVSLAGIVFNKKPYSGLWKEIANLPDSKNGESNVAYYPIIDTREGFDIAKRIDAMEWGTEELQEMCRVKDPRTFALWFKFVDVCGIIVDDEKYTPVDGLKEISRSEYDEINAG